MTAQDDIAVVTSESTNTEKNTLYFSALVGIISILLILPPYILLINNHINNGGVNNALDSVKRLKSEKSLSDEKHLNLLSNGAASSCGNNYPVIKISPSEGFGIVVMPNEDRTHDPEDKVITETPRVDEDGEEERNNVEDFVSKEAETNMRKAKELAASGNRKLARKLFKHALALDPKSIDVLTNFGEFLENENIVQADLLYQRALAYDPNHSTAMTNRERTAPIVKKHDKEIFEEIDQRKVELYTHSSHHPLLRSYMKESYYHHIYHTVALEGNKLTLEEMRVIIDHRIGVNGRSLHEHNEVIGLSDALHYVNNTLLHKLGSITVTDIKNLHKRVMGRTDPYIAGQFRSSQVFVGRHIPPHPSDVDEFMESFEEWINSPQTLQLHPVEFAALVHYRLVFIHPFLDGNGRTARLLMNLVLMRYGIPPVSIQVQDRWIYYQTLTQANDGDIRPFVRFIAHCTRQTLDDYLFLARLPPHARLQDEKRTISFNEQKKRTQQQKLNLFNDDILNLLYKRGDN